MNNDEKKERPGRKSYSVDPHRPLPQAPDAEKGVLCSVLLNADFSLSICEERGTAEVDFHIPGNARIWQELLKMREEKVPIEFITLTQRLRDQDALDSCGGAAYITELFTWLPTAANCGYYAQILAEKTSARRLIQECTEIIGRAYDEQDAIAELVDEAQTKILAIQRPDCTGTETIVPIKKAVVEAIENLEAIYHTRGGVIGLPTGYVQIDRMTGGAKSEEMIVVAARPSMGKSSLLMGIAEHVSIECGKGVLVFSLEMNYVQLAQRAVLGRAHINIQRVRDGFFSRDQFDRTLPKSSQEVAAAPIWIDDTPGLSIQELRARARRFVKAHPEVKAIFVDYLQLLRSTTRRNNENREREIAEISGGLKVLARQLKMPVFTAAQLNRENDGANSKPKLSNLRESGTIEQDADVVLLLHRRYYYTEDAEDRGKATVFLAKQRNGPTGEVELTFWDEFARFENPANEALYSNDPRKRQGWKEGDAND